MIDLWAGLGTSDEPLGIEAKLSMVEGTGRSRLLAGEVLGFAHCRGKQRLDQLPLRYAVTESRSKSVTASSDTSMLMRPAVLPPGLC